MAKTITPADTQEMQAQQAAFERFKAKAKALPADAVKVRGDAHLALENVRTGLKNVLERRAELDGVWPSARVDALADVVPLAEATAYAAGLAQLSVESGKNLQQRITSCYEERDKLLSALIAAVKFGLLPAGPVERLQVGRGSLKAAQSLVNIVAFWQANKAKLLNKTPAMDDDLVKADTLGNGLVLDLKPSAAPAREDTLAKASADLANRFWTLLVNAQFELLKAGFELWGREYPAHVPSLLSRIGTKKEKPESPPAGGGSNQTPPQEPQVEEAPSSPAPAAPEDSAPAAPATQKTAKTPPAAPKTPGKKAQKASKKPPRNARKKLARRPARRRR